MVHSHLSKRLFQSILFKPKSVEYPFAWAGHLHFANFLVSEIKPTIFVELGTHSGNSYFAFCQSVKELNLPTKCFAVDTWVGDSHSGNYDQDIYEYVKDINSSYSNFSTLLKMKFDEAVLLFEDKSINVLHIDGLHTYKAVKYDFETWFPKLADDAIVLMHDTQVFEDDFGAWQLWEELKVKYSLHIELKHSNGLGVLQINHINTNQKNIDWLDKNNDSSNYISSTFNVIGENFKKLKEIEFKVKKMNQERQEFSSIELDYRKKIKNLEIKCQTGFEAQIKLNIAKAEILSICNSISWKITKPFREINRLINHPRKQLIMYLEWIACNQTFPLSDRNKNNISELIRLINNNPINNSNLSIERARLLDLLSASSEYQRLKHLDHEQLISRLLEIIDDYKAPLTVGIPVVSIIIPVYGKVEFTLCALISILKNLPKTTFEVIVIDDYSQDKSFEIIGKMNWVTLKRNSKNEGFIRSCNNGAVDANGKYLYFLNNDVEVCDGWLDSLVDTFNNFPGTGLVGSKLIYPDGSLQEAGAIVWKDASAWNYGRGSDQGDPSYNYAREVDYCSGASIMIPKRLFNELGGFDEQFMPAYYEDVDIAFKLRELGYRVIYQPLSIVIHHEGMSSGRDISQGVKAFQEVNKIKFLERWGARLVNYQVNGENPDEAKDRRHTHRILVLDNNTFTPDEDAGSLLMFNFCLLLRELNFQVTFIPTSSMVMEHRHTIRLQKMGIEVIYSPYIESIEQHLNHHGARYDAVMLIRPDCFEREIGIVKKYCLKAKIIYHTIDLHYLRMIRESIIKSAEDIMTQAMSMKARELNAIEKSDLTIAVTEEDRKAIRDVISGKNIYKLGLILNTNKKINNFNSRRGIVFVGGFAHAPNLDAVMYFINEVMPALIEFHPEVEFSIVGSNIPPSIYNYESKNIRIVGYVENLENFLSTKLVNIAPLRFGAGIKGKIANAMSVGLPTVATEIAAEGMGVENNRNILIANQPHEIVRAIDQLLTNKNLWEEISENGVNYAELTWGGQVLCSELISLFSILDISVNQGPYPLKLYSDELA